MRRRIGITLVVVVVLVGLGFVGAGWYYADQILAPGTAEAPTYDVTVTALSGDEITLQASAETADYERRDLTTDLVLGLATPHDYLRLTGSVRVEDADTATRRFETVNGTPPAVGDVGELDVYAYPDDPAILGIPVESVMVPTPVGDAPAWEFPADGDTWAVVVHGRGATRAEALRAVNILHGAGLPVLVVTYRGDGIAPPSPDGHSHYGDTEWEDVQAAIDWLQDTVGAQDLVLYGYSQGGGIVATTLRRTPDHDAIVGAVLDSPLLSLSATLRLQAKDRSLPGPVIPPLLTVAKAIADVRGGLDFAAAEHVAAADAFSTPILLFHGREDRTVPFGPSQELAEARPDLVTFVPYDGDHVRGWNVDPEGYAAAVTDFLAGILR